MNAETQPERWGLICERCPRHVMPTHIGAMSRHRYLWPVGGLLGTPKGKVVLKREQERKRGWKITQKHCRNYYCEAIMRFDFGLLRLKYSIQEVHINDKHIWVWHSEHCGHELEQHGASSGFRWGLGGLSSADSAGTSCKLSGVNLKTLHPTQSSNVLRFMDVMLTKMEYMFLFVCHHLKVKIHIDSRERLRCL